MARPHSGSSAPPLPSSSCAGASSRRTPSRDSAADRDLASVLAGLALIFRNKLLLGAISLDLFAVLFSGATALIPVFAKDILGVGADAGGLLRSAQGLGAVATAAVLTLQPIQRHVGARLFMAVGIFGVAAVVFGLSQHYWLSFLAVLVLGAADMVSVYIRGTLVPLATPDALRGRVVAVEAVFIGASNELGTFVAGSAAALLGAVTAVMIGGSLTLAGYAVLGPALSGLATGRSVRDPGADVTEAQRRSRAAPSSPSAIAISPPIGSARCSAISASRCSRRRCSGRSTTSPAARSISA